MTARFLPARYVLRLSSLASAVVIGLSGCGSGGTTNPGPTGSIAISLGTSAATVADGAGTSIAVTVTRGGGFTGAVSLSVDGLPTGVLSTVSNQVTTGTTTTATLAIAVGGSVAPNGYSLTVRAAGSGVTDATASFSLTVVAVATGSVALSLNPNALTVQQGANGTTQVTITRTNFSGGVALTAEGLPNGVTASFNPASTAAASSVLTLTVGAAVAAQQYSLTIRGKGTGVADATAALTLTVTAVQANGGYTLAPATSPITVPQGGNGQTAINITRTGGFAGSVTLTVEGAPAKLNASLNPAATTGSTSTLSLVAAADLAPNSYTLTIRGTAAGLTDRTATVTVTVTAAGGSGNVTVDATTCGLEPVVWLAYQDGSGSWTPVTAAANVYHFSITNPTGGVAWVTSKQGSSVRSTFVRFQTKAELSAGTITACPLGPVNLKSVNGVLANVGASLLVDITLGGAFLLASSATTNFTIPFVPDGTHDLIAYRYGAAVGPADRAIIHRDLDIPNNGTVGTLDFAAAEAFAPSVATVTVPGFISGDGLVVDMAYLTGASCELAPLYQMNQFAGTFQFTGIPAAQQRASDLHALSVSEVNTIGNRVVQEIFHTVGNRTVTPPSPLVNPTITELAGNYKRMQAVFGLGAEYNGSAAFTYNQSQGVPHPVSIIASAGWIGGTTATLALPNFTGLAGWDDTWGPTSGLPNHWSIVTTGGTASGSLCTDGAKNYQTVVTGSH